MSFCKFESRIKYKIISYFSLVLSRQLSTTVPKIKSDFTCPLDLLVRIRSFRVFKQLFRLHTILDVLVLKLLFM